MEKDLYTTLIYKALKGAITPAEQKRLAEWSALRPENAAYRREIEWSWRLSSDAEIGEIDVEADLRTVKHRMVMEEQAKTTAEPKIVPLWLKISSIAAIGMLLLLAYFAVIQRGGTEQYTMMSKDSRKHLTLEDGSQVWLNKNSALTFPEKFSSNIRKIRMRGEAYFEVVRDENAPFIIEVGSSEVEVLGTAFSIKEDSLNKQLLVHVQSGKVSLSNAQGKVILEKGQQGVHHWSSGGLSQKNTNTQNAIAWKTGRYVFKKVSLAEAVEQLESMFQVSITIQDPLMKSCEVVAMINATELEDILEKISQTFQMDWTKINERSFSLNNGKCQ